jgi:hypothetical protein
VISSGFGILKKVLEPFHAEIVACMQAVQRAAELGVQRIIVQTDAAMVVQAVNSEDFDTSTASGLIWELKDLIACNFSSVNLVHVTRSCNTVAHNLAALGATLSSIVFLLVFRIWLPKIWHRLICNGELFHVQKTNRGLFHDGNTGKFRTFQHHITHFITPKTRRGRVAICIKQTQ